MAHETLIKRTIWVAKCKHDRVIQSENRSKERYCTECKKWVRFKEQSYTGPSLQTGRK